MIGAQKSIKARMRAGAVVSTKLNSKIRIFAILWFVLVAATLICLLFLFQNVMNYNNSSSSDLLDTQHGGAAGGLLHQINNVNQVDSVKSYVKDLISKHPHLRKKNGQSMNLAKDKQQQQQQAAVAADAGGNEPPPIRPEDAETIAYAVSVTGCGADPLTEGAAVLKHSIHRVSVRGDLGGRYNYKMYAIYHPQAIACAKTLEALGYELLERDVFVKVEDIEGEYLRKNIEKNGCCGEKELIKLEAYTLTQHPVVVHLDLDVLVLKPLDDLFDVMLSSRTKAEDEPLDLTQISVMWPPKGEAERPTQVNAFFTRDYNMVGSKKKYKPVQGGLLVLRPSIDVYNEFKAIVKKGDFREHGGWGGLVGPFYGSMTFQGIMPYYYDVLHEGEALELNRCVVNQMCDNPRDQKTVNDVVHGNCRTGEEDCEDCRSRPLEDVITAHFTLCQKPWLCLPHDMDQIQHRLCRKLHHEWYLVRSEMEKSWGRSGTGEGEWQQEQFFGYCKEMGNKGYVPIATPYGIA